MRAAGDDPALRSALWFSDRTRSQRRQVERLRRGLEGAELTKLPLVFGGLQRTPVESLAARLGPGQA